MAHGPRHRQPVLPSCVIGAQRPGLELAVRVCYVVSGDGYYDCQNDYDYQKDK